MKVDAAQFRKAVEDGIERQQAELERQAIELVQSVQDELRANSPRDEGHLGRSWAAHGPEGPGPAHGDTVDSPGAEASVALGGGNWRIGQPAGLDSQTLYSFKAALGVQGSKGSGWIPQSMRQAGRK